ncbi:coiled-coil domain-containing protein 137 isoform X1 [Neofelis nebulosa]|uniref:coiled-coil domain-containing protein 137 isoform X1 n=1 Tax=Neofelis nebulosa TaxID=61452 RepID=UPI00272B332D|nr:coiled-coil domain-containing protein 137 isoform X1 [Neofelis nebulosa]
MAGAGRRGATTVGTAGPGGPGRPQGRKQQLPGKQRSAPWPGQRSKEKKKVNCKPPNQDEQEIPFRLREIMRSRQEMKNPISNKKRKKEAQMAFRKTLEKEAKGVEPDIAVPKFKQRKWESDGAYIQRMEQEAQHVLFLSKNQVARQPEVQVAPKKEKSERKKAFQKRRLDRVRQRREEKTAERLERELLRGGSSEATASASGPAVFPGHGEVWRGCPAAPRADRPAQDEQGRGPAWEEIADAEDASEPWWCVPASDRITGPTADCWGGETAGCAGLPGTKDAAAAGGSVPMATPFTPPRFQEEGRDLSVTV